VGGGGASDLDLERRTALVMRPRLLLTDGAQVPELDLARNVQDNHASGSTIPTAAAMNTIVLNRCTPMRTSTC
jgi:hypothetical protein